MSANSGLTALQPVVYLANSNVAAHARAIADHAGEKSILLLTTTSHAAAELYDALHFFLPEQSRNVLQLFGDYETLPYDVFSPSADLVSDRLKVLYRLTRGGNMITITSVTSVLHRLPPPTYLHQHALLIQKGEKIPDQGLRSALVDAGYQQVETVRETGQFALRGSILDLFPSGTELACRIDFFDDEIESIRLFDPDTQLSVEKVDRVELIPAREFPLDKDAIQFFRNRWLQRFDTDPRQSQIYQAVSRGHSAQGIENYLPLFFEHTHSLFDYLPEKTQLYMAGKLSTAIEALWRQISQRHQQYGGNIEYPLLEPYELFHSASDLFAEIKKFQRFQWQENTPDEQQKLLPDVALHYKAKDPFTGLKTLLADQKRTLICAESAGRREVLLDTLAQGQLNPTPFASWQEFLTSDSPFGITLGQIRDGCIFAEEGLAVIAENDLLTEKVAAKTSDRKTRRRQEVESEQIIRNLTELRVGAPVVHIEHGVGRFLGLETIRIDGRTDEFLTLEYADQNKLYVPVHSLNLVSRYTGADAEHAPLNRLGTDQWDKAKRKAREKIRDTAAELLEIYAARQAKSGMAHAPDQDAYAAFCQEFPFEETEDQRDCIAAMEADMLSARPMDRLVCGDVGFGKTEIALRASFIATSSSKQVVLLVPTTLLARQHLDTFRDRFANWPIRVDSVSRLKTQTEQKQVMEAFSKGELDIIIGTHKLIHEAIKTERLGLLIVDEEHRFGVHQKEKLKSLKAEVDILTLTATPIPRTLNMAMASIRDLSILATPPARRLAIKTFVRPEGSRLLEEAIRRELMRGGQIYLLHNEIRSIERRAEDIRQLVPEARVGVAHGQMREQELEKIVSDFYHQRFDILVCTTIIETGIDIPTANTIVIDRADKFGLAQLHQLRGRVGRSHHQAYAYLLTPDSVAMTNDAKKRLVAIQEADHLGCGFTLATHDMEIRGAGELLGEQQSGQIHAIGFELFQQMLEKAVKQLQSGSMSETESEHEVDIQLGVPALIPDDYLADISGRLQLYKRIASAEDDAQLENLQVEMIDRFGLLPAAAKNLFVIARLKIMAHKLGIQKIDCNDKQGSFHFIDQPNVDPMQLIEMVQREPARYRFQGAGRLQFFDDLSEQGYRIHFIEALLQKLLERKSS